MPRAPLTVLTTRALTVDVSADATGMSAPVGVHREVAGDPHSAVARKAVTIVTNLSGGLSYVFVGGCGQVCAAVAGRERGLIERGGMWVEGHVG